jgi:putative phosphonate metabolism protein
MQSTPSAAPAARYAIYFVPDPDSALYRFGSSILGYDCYSRADVPFADDLAIDAARWHKLTDEPRRYGFHATLKAPFRLSPSCTEAQLASALESFAALGRVIPTFTPAIRMLSGFVAIVPQRPRPRVNTLAADCVTIFDAFRAPMSPQERARRVASGLNPSQIVNLDRWGYPYLFDEFRFHMTLTAKVGLDQRDGVLASLREAFARCCGQHPVVIDRLALMRQDGEDSRFHVVRHAALRVSQSRP